jgi:hypothetical protein
VGMCGKETLETRGFADGSMSFGNHLIRLGSRLEGQELRRCKGQKDTEFFPTSQLFGAEPDNTGNPRGRLADKGDGFGC